MRESAKPDKGPRKGLSLLAVTFVLSLVLLVVVSGWLLTDPSTSHADALRTGGLAGGAVVALYALWLNDRRRHVEENRQKVERERYELELLRAERDRDRVADERFAKCVELLGHEADQVRVGGLHALAGLAHDRPRYTQTVLDVLCSYLRRPFENPNVEDNGEKTGGKTGEKTKDPDVERELQVRLTTQRLIAELLPEAGTGEETFDLDLTGASLEYFDLSGRRVGTLSLRRAELLSRTEFTGCELVGPAWFTDATFAPGRLRGYFHCTDVTFHDRAWFHRTKFDVLARFDDTTFEAESNFKDAVFSGDARFDRTAFRSSLDLHSTRFDGQANLELREPPRSLSLYNTLVDPDLVQLPDFWTLEARSDGRTRIVPRS